MNLISKFLISFSKFVINLAIIYLFTGIIEFIAQSLNYYIPFEFTLILVFIFYLLLTKVLKLRTFEAFVFERFAKYKIYIVAAITLLVLIFIGFEILKAKDVFDVDNYYLSYALAEPNYTDKDSTKCVDISSIDSTNETIYIDWINRNGRPPLEYIINKITQHEVLVFGETHEQSNYLIFLNKIIPDLYKAGVRVIALEVCLKEDNDTLEKLVNDKEYDKEVALKIARRQTWLAWGWKDYWDIFESVWSLNKKLKSEQEKMKVIGLYSKTDMPSISLILPGDNSKSSTFFEKFRIFRVLTEIPKLLYNDELMAKETEDQIIKKNKKGIIWVGSSHSYLNFKQPHSQKGRMAYILNKKFGDKVFQIYLHQNDYSNTISKFLEKEIFKSNLNQVGFDVTTSPFSEIRDNSSDYFKNRPMIKFGDIASGYLYLCPVDSLKHCEFIPDFVTQKTFVREKPFFEAVIGKKLENADDVNKYYENKYNK